MLAVSNAEGTYYRYLKLWLLQRDRMKDGFVVLTYNRPMPCWRCCAAWRRNAAPRRGGHRRRWLAAGARAGPARGLPAFACPVRHVWHPDVGFTAARARNLGARHAQADYLVFLDGDCVPGRGFVEHHCALAQQGHFVNGSRVLLSEALSRRVLEGEMQSVRPAAARLAAPAPLGRR